MKISVTALAYFEMYIFQKHTAHRKYISGALALGANMQTKRKQMNEATSASERERATD